MTVLGVVEMGGTKTDVAFGTSPDDLSAPSRIATTTPDGTLDAVVEFFATHPVAAIGVSSFGPLDLDPSSESYGSILATPKPGWSGADVLGRLAGGTGVPVAIDTDVNGAALGEGRWGAGKGMTDFAYMTVGTGIGIGVVAGGKLVGGNRHPEGGHIVVSRLDGDSHPGSCPYHDDCLEGMAAGPALEARFGPPERWAGDGSVLSLVSGYVAQGVRNLVYTVAPERVVIGGGVSTLPGFHVAVRSRVGSLLGGYPAEPDLDLLVSRPGLGDRSALAGGLVLAAGAG